MAAQRGTDLLLRVANGGSFESVAGLRARRLSFNADAVDATTSDSLNRWRELLADTGVRRASVSGGGLFKDSASDARVRELFFNGEQVQWQIVIPDFGTIEGPFQITALEYSGSYNSELTFDMALESAGNITFTGL